MTLTEEKRNHNENPFKFIAFSAKKELKKEKKIEANRGKLHSVIVTMWQWLLRREGSEEQQHSGFMEKYISYDELANSPLLARMHCFNHNALRHEKCKCTRTSKCCLSASELFSQGFSRSSSPRRRKALGTRLEFSHEKGDCIVLHSTFTSCTAFAFVTFVSLCKIFLEQITGCTIRIYFFLANNSDIWTLSLVFHRLVEF